MDQVRVMEIVNRLCHLVNYILLVTLLKLSASTVFAD